MLEEVLDDGVLLYDPYGCGLAAGFYLRNEKKFAELRSAARGSPALLEKRWSHAPERLAEWDAAEPGQVLSNLGKGSFYDWSEVQRWSIGSSVVSVSRAQELG